MRRAAQRRAVHGRPHGRTGLKGKGPRYRARRPYLGAPRRFFRIIPNTHLHRTREGVKEAWPGTYAAFTPTIDQSPLHFVRAAPASEDPKNGQWVTRNHPSNTEPTLGAGCPRPAPHHIIWITHDPHELPVGIGRFRRHASPIRGAPTPCPCPQFLIPTPVPPHAKTERRRQTRVCFGGKRTTASPKQARGGRADGPTVRESF